MNWFDNEELQNNPGLNESLGKEEVFEAVTLDSDSIQAFAKKFGLELGKDDQGDYMVVPHDLSQQKGFNTQFIDYWVNQGNEKNNLEQGRKLRNNSYELMDRILGEAILTLNAYADEALGIAFLEQPIDIKISDPKIEEDVLEILRRNGIIKRSRSHIRNLCKWGDLLALISSSPDSNDPLDLKIKMVTPDKWEAFFIHAGPVPLGYLLGCPDRRTKRVRKEDILQPWECIQFTIPDDEFAPYGRSLLEAMRTAFDQLVTIEALLAMSRAARVERLVVRIPTQTTNPTASLSKLNQIKSIWKNMIFTDKSGKHSHAKTPSMQDVLFLPSKEDGFDIDRLSAGSGVELSNVEDVEHFNNKVLMMSGLPKGYLLADESTDRYHALTAQDLKFTRQLIPYQDGYATGLTKLCMVLVGYLGGDIENTEVTVKIKRPVQTSDQLLQNTEAISRAASEMIDNYRRSVTNPEDEESAFRVDPNLYPKLLAELGMPEAIVNLFTPSPADDPNLPTNSPDDDEISTITASLERYIKEMRSNSNWVSISSKEVFTSNRKVFELLNSPRRGSTASTSLLNEAIDSDNKLPALLTPLSFKKPKKSNKK